MTKFSLLVGELGNDPTETDESKIYSTLASMAILAQLKPDAMKNSLTKDDVNLPMEFFRLKTFRLGGDFRFCEFQKQKLVKTIPTKYSNITIPA